MSINFIKIQTVIIALTWSTGIHAVLIERLGGLAYYDTDADLTWLADANYAQTSGYDSDGKMNWADASTWAANLDVNGITDWRLPSSSASEMQNLSFNVLGGVDGYNIINTHNDNYYLFSNILSNSYLDYYWTSTEQINTYYPSAYIFEFIYGCQCYNQVIYEGLSWAVRDGDISAVPLPAASWLLFSGLIGFISFAKRKNT